MHSQQIPQSWPIINFTATNTTGMHTPWPHRGRVPSSSIHQPYDHLGAHAPSTRGTAARQWIITAAATSTCRKHVPCASQPPMNYTPHTAAFPPSPHTNTRASYSTSSSDASHHYREPPNDECSQKSSTQSPQWRPLPNHTTPTPTSLGQPTHTLQRV